MNMIAKELPIREISSLEDVKTFYRHLIENEELNFHPDDDFEDYVTPADTPAYTSENAQVRNELNRQAFEVCEREGVEVYSVALHILRKELRKRFRQYQSN